MSGGPPPEGPGPGAHLHAVDVVRLLTVVGVIVVHSTSLTDEAGSDATGGVLVVLHVTRGIFLFLSAFVLAHSYRVRPETTASAWWGRRFPLVLVPYAAWSAIYLLADGARPSVAQTLATYTVDLADGGAQFHLYFLLVTFQLYLVFPALLAFLTRHDRLHVPLLVTSVGFQLTFTAAVHYGWRPPVLGAWLNHPGSWLPSYQLYLAAGVLAALHLDAVTGWVRRHHRVIVAGFVASVILSLTSYVIDLTVLGYGPTRASQVFQPVVVIEAAGVLGAQYALGLWATDRMSVRRARQLERSSDVSFGVYLAHPLIIAALLYGAGALGLTRAVDHLPSGVVEAMVVVGLVPLVYVLSVLGVSQARRTRCSLALSGRRRHAVALSPASSSPGPAPDATMRRIDRIRSTATETGCINAGKGSRIPATYGPFDENHSLALCGDSHASPNPATAYRRES